MKSKVYNQQESAYKEKGPLTEEKNNTRNNKTRARHGRNTTRKRQELEKNRRLAITLMRNRAIRLALYRRMYHNLSTTMNQGETARQTKNHTRNRTTQYKKKTQDMNKTRK